MDTNEFKKLSPADKGMIIRKLQGEGNTIEKAAFAVGMNPNYARRCARIADMTYGNAEKPNTDNELQEALFKIAELSQAVRARLDPIVTHKAFEFDNGVAIMMASCMHLGGRWTSHKTIKDKVHEALDAGIYIGLFGDDIDGFWPGSFAGVQSVNEQALSVDLQQKLFELYLDDIKDNVLWGMWGQHGAVWNEKRGQKYIKECYTARGITFFDGAGYIKIGAGENVYNVAVSHKFAGHSMYNPVHAQKRALWQRFPNADVIAMGDKHTFAMHQESAYNFEYMAGNRPSPMVTLLQIGTAKIGNDVYTLRGWENGVCEWPIVYFDADTHRVKVTTDIEDARRWIA